MRHGSCVFPPGVSCLCIRLSMEELSLESDRAGVGRRFLRYYLIKEIRDGRASWAVRMFRRDRLSLGRRRRLAPGEIILGERDPALGQPDGQ